MHDGRGGYCFEQNLLLSYALQALGFKVKWHAARVLWNVPDGAVTARTHMLLSVDLDEERFVVDVGFGGLTLTGALRLEPDTEQATPHEPFRLVSTGEEFVGASPDSYIVESLYRFALSCVAFWRKTFASRFPRCPKWIPR